jgi:hypothetical protein
VCHREFSDSVSWVDVPDSDGFFGCGWCTHVVSVVIEAPRRIERSTHLLTKSALSFCTLPTGRVQCANVPTIVRTMRTWTAGQLLWLSGGAGIPQTVMILKWYADCPSEG